SPVALRALVPLMWLAGALRLDRVARALPAGSRLRSMLELTPRAELADARARLPSSWAARGERRGRAALLQGCVQRVLFNDVNIATAELLASEGWDVHAPEAPGCCGALELHTGYGRGAAARAKETIAAFEGCDRIVTNAAGCGSALKEYGHLLR